MINYTESLTRLARDIVARVDAFSFIDPASLLIFARFGRTGADGALATCHCLCLPESEPGYYFWRDRVTGELTRRSEWFVPRTPRVTVRSQQLDYLISVALPRFCDQSLTFSRKKALYPGEPAWIAKLDTVVHELYHIDPARGGIRQMASDNGGQASWCHGPAFYANVAALVRRYLASAPDPTIYDFLRHDFAELQARFGRVTAATFRNFPSYPQVYLDRLPEQPVGPDAATIVPLRRPTQPALYTERDLVVREFLATSSRRMRLDDIDGRSLPPLPVGRAARKDVAPRPVRRSQQLYPNHAA